MPIFYKTFKVVGIVLISLAQWAKEDRERRYF